MPSYWLLTAAGNDRVYRANQGYADDPERTYRYTNAVQNHRRLGKGDVVLIHDKRRLLGLARIQEINKSDGSRVQKRCPECDLARIRPLKRQPYGFKCDKGHWFADPITREVDTTFYEAEFGGSYVPALEALPLDELFAACPKHNPRVAMHPIDLHVVASRIISAAPAASRIIDGDYLMEDDAAEDNAAEGDLMEGYVRGAQDTREQVMRSIRLRRGQRTFRKRLLDRYGSGCMVSGCGVIHAVEAAHISSYRDGNDHHPENGLLLRADLHTLFDLDLIGINPDTLQVVVHPEIRFGQYAKFHGTLLRCGPGVRPSPSALAARWRVFNSRDAGVGN